VVYVAVQEQASATTRPLDGPEGVAEAVHRNCGVAVRPHLGGQELGYLLLLATWARYGYDLLQKL